MIHDDTLASNTKIMKDETIYSEAVLREKLTPIQYKVTQENGTERAFENEYHDNEEDGIYVDIIDGTPLFSSRDKFDSGTGWPSFTKPISEENIAEYEDNWLFSRRTEVRSESSDAHLGHVFPDGPKAAGGLRYCMNSAALRFIPASELKEEWYEKYAKNFELKNNRVILDYFLNFHFHFYNKSKTHVFISFVTFSIPSSSTSSYIIFSFQFQSINHFAQLGLFWNSLRYPKYPVQFCQSIVTHIDALLALNPLKSSSLDFLSNQKTSSLIQSILILWVSYLHFAS